MPKTVEERRQDALGLLREAALEALAEGIPLAEIQEFVALVEHEERGTE